MTSYIVKDKRNHEYHVEEFRSTAELVRTNEVRNYTEHQRKGSDLNFGSWSGGIESLEEAYALLKNGWNEPVKELKTHIDEVKTSPMDKRIGFRNNVIGFAPVVPLAIMGVPNSMIDMTMKPIKSKVVTIVFDSGAICGVTSEKMMESGTNVVKAIINLEKSGYRVAVKLMMSFNQGERSDVALISIKESNQPLDLSRIAFPLIHTAMFRIIGFDWEDKALDTQRMFARGTSLDNATNLRSRESVKEAFGDNFYYISHRDAIRGNENIERILKGGDE